METKIIEINGIKMEVDLRTASMKKVEAFKVGDAVKVLINDYSKSVKPGVIIGFENFKELPSICVAYLDYSELKFAHINSNTKNEIVFSESHDLINEKDWILTKMDQDITKKELELNQVKAAKKMFVGLFGKYFEKPIERAAQ